MVALVKNQIVDLCPLKVAVKKVYTVENILKFPNERQNKILLILIDDFMNYLSSSMFLKEIPSLKGIHPQYGTNILDNHILSSLTRKIF